MRKVVTLAATVILLSGCNNPGLIHKKYDADATSLSIGARQRIVMSVERRGQRIICAEPSPDMFAVIAAETAASAQGALAMNAPARRTRPVSSAGESDVQFDGDASGSFNHAVTETGTEFANRSQTIQVLRDGMYRACEAYMNGAIGKDEYKQILSKQDDMLLTLISVEQLGDAAIGESEKADAIYKIVHDYMCLQMAEKSYSNETVVNNICNNE